MKSTAQGEPLVWPLLAWLSVALAGFLAPAIAMLLLAGTPSPPPLILISGLILAVSLMGSGMIGAAVAGRFWGGILLALFAGASLMLLARAVGVPSTPDLFSIGFAMLIASISFAARGALFARSAGGRGWWIAVFVVAGEAAILLTAFAQPGALPDWLLALLPAQWAAMGIQAALTGKGALAASAALIALSGTAAATLLVASLWPRRWPYLVMFTTWLGLSALVYHNPGPALLHSSAAVDEAPTP